MRLISSPITNYSTPNDTKNMDLVNTHLDALVSIPLAEFSLEIHNRFRAVPMIILKTYVVDIGPAFTPIYFIINALNKFIHFDPPF